MSSISPIIFKSKSFEVVLISDTPTFVTFPPFSEAKARSARLARLYNDVLSGCVAKCALMDVGICRMKAWRMTALPTTADAPRPEVF